LRTRHFAINYTVFNSQAFFMKLKRTSYVENTSVCLSVCDAAFNNVPFFGSSLNSVQSFFTNTLSSKCQFSDTPLTDSHTLLRRIKEFILLISTVRDRSGLNSVIISL